MAMDRHTEAVDVYSIFKPVFVVSKVLGLSPYSAIGDIGNERSIVAVYAILYNLGMIIINVALLSYGVVTTITTWENICTLGESIMYLGTVCHAVSAYFTWLLGRRQTAQHFERLNDLIGKTYYSVWRRDVQLLLAMQMLCVIMIVTGAVLELSDALSQFYNIYLLFTCVFYYVSDLAGFMSEHQFVAFMRILKRTVQNWNNHIHDVTENDEVIDKPLNRKLMNGQKSDIFTVSKTSTNSNSEKMHLKVVHFQQLRELHASACDIAESFNAIYSTMLLLSVAKSFMLLTHIMYYILISFIVQKTSFFCHSKPNTCYFVWLIIYSLRLLWLVHSTASTAKEVSHNV
jgi:hypothetical protein